MGRIRSIKPEILDDAKTAELGHLEWRLFVSMFVMADDYGNLRGHPSQLKGVALWGTKDSPKEVGDAVAKLVQVGLLISYRVGGQGYLHIAGWSKHQLVKHPGKPLMPGPQDADNSSAFSDDGERQESLPKSSGGPPETRTADLDQRSTTNEQDQRPSAASRGKRATSLSETWAPNGAHSEQAAAARVDVRREADRFRDHAAATGRVAKDRDAAFRNWLRKSEDIGGRGGNASPGGVLGALADQLDDIRRGS